jgi:hypothetical protein
MQTRVVGTMIAALMCSAAAQAQEEFSLNWHTIDCGGGESVGQTTGEEWVLIATIAQPDAGFMTGPESVETFSIQGGFWAFGNPCFANCDDSSIVPVLTSNDFQCFLNRFAAGDAYANCDGSSGTPALTSNDFQCFLNAFAAGCP